METEASWTNEFVDIHGHQLNALITEDRSIFIPLKEIRKAGYHIFPKSDFDQSLVGYPIILNEFYNFMLGAAREFLIQNSIRVLNDQEILRTIEKCRKELNIQDSDDTYRIRGTLGRTLLVDSSSLNHNLPVLKIDSRRASNSSLDGKNNERTMNSSQGVRNLRMSHQEEENPVRYSSQDNLHNRKQYNRNDRYGNSNGVTNSAPVHNSNPRHHTDFIPNAKHLGRRDPQTYKDNNTGPGNSIKVSECNVKRINLEQTVQKIKVSHVDSHAGREFYWIQLADNEDVLFDILEKCMDAADTCESVTPNVGGIYMAYCEEDTVWYRVVVLQVIPSIKVHYIDYGNDGVVTKVKAQPKSVASIPAQSRQVTFCKDTQPSRIYVDQVLFVSKHKEYENGVTLVKTSTQSLVNNQAKGDVSETIMMKEIRYSSTLEDKGQVKIVSQENGKFYLRDKEHHTTLRQIIMKHLNELPREVVRNPKVGQLVFCKKSDEEGFCRAVIRSVDDILVSVQYVDYHVRDIVSHKAVYGVSKKTATLPMSLIESPVIKGYDPLRGFGEEAEALLEEYIANNVKFTVAYDGVEFDLIQNGDSLSEKLFGKPERVPTRSTPAAKPATSSTTPTRAATTTAAVEKVVPSVVPLKTPESDLENACGKTMFYTMLNFEAPMAKDDYMVTVYKSPFEFTVVPTGDLETELLSKCTAIDVTDTEEYEPDEAEMILGRFEGEWYRAAVIEKIADGLYSVLFVDYGNQAELTPEDIRRFPEELQQIRCMGLCCRMDVPNDEKVANRLKDLLQPNSIYELEVVAYDQDTTFYKVNIPKLELVLKKEGLL